MIDWLTGNWTMAVSWLSAGGALAAALRFAPKGLRRIALMLDCEVDRLRWEEADRLRNREIGLLRQDVANLQDDIARLLARSVASGATSGDATPATPSGTAGTRTRLPPSGT
jgi:hypothetical protein